MYMTPGLPLGEDEKEHVERVLCAEAAAGHTSMYTPDFLRLLGWPQRRLPDLRDYLEHNQCEVAKRLSSKLGRTVLPRIFVTRSQLDLKLPNPNQCQGCGRKLEELPKYGHFRGCLLLLTEPQRRAAEIVQKVSPTLPLCDLIRKHLAVAFADFLSIEEKDRARFYEVCEGRHA
jgi:hypothetical protein